mgnify:CR=1 FL=1
MSEQVLQSSSPRIDLHMGIRWLRGREEMKWTGGFTAWFIGKKKSGKSNGGELVAVKCKNAGASTIFDTCASGDGENFAWLRSPYKDNILIVHGSGMKVTAPCHTMHVAEFNLKECEKYSVVITNPALYRERRDYYTALAYIMDNHFMKRTVFTTSIVHLIREARKILMSRFIAGKATNIALAQEQFIEMHNESEHTAIANVIDALRPNSIVPDVRELANYTFIKTFGAMRIPRDMFNILKKVKPQWMRRMPPDRFVLYTDADNVGVGNLDLVPWHHKRGEPILNQVGVEIEPVEDRPKGEDAKELTQVMLPNAQEVSLKEKRIEENTVLHLLMLELHKQGLTYRQIWQRLIEEKKIPANESWHKVRYHMVGRCLCKIDTE